MKQTGWVVGAALLLLMLGAPSAGAHALLASSDPSDGQRLEVAPPSVRITFTEPPDPQLSSIEVLDSSGGSWTSGAAGIDPEDPNVYSVELEELPIGSYTATWRVVSRVDGHLTSGAFVFGVGVEPQAADTVDEVAPPAPFVGTLGRWAFYLGLSLLVGAAWTSLFAFRSDLRAGRSLAAVGAVLALVGLAGIEEGQRILTTLGPMEFLATETGRGILWRGAGLVVAITAVGVYLARKWPRASAVLVLAGAAAAALAHAATGHAGAGSLIAGKVALQWIHMMAAAAWIGGLAALLMGVRGEVGERESFAAGRFSKVAGVAIALVAITGVLRAIGEVGSLPALWDAPYGRIVLVKSGILLALAAFGAFNRYRSLPEFPRRPHLLRRVGSVELLVAVGAFVASSLLAQGVPPATIAAAEGRGPIVVEASDFAESLRASLEIRPGTPGPSDYTLRIEDFDSGDAVEAEIVRLTFEYLGTTEVGSSTLEMERTGPGLWRAGGPNLSLAGRWRITALVQQEATSSEITFEIETRSPEVRVQQVEGQPTLYTVEIGAGRTAQVYTDPEQPGFSQLHVTFFTPEGTELPLSELQMEVTTPEGDQIELEERRFGPGHFVADVDLTEGTWRLMAEGVTEEEEPVIASLEFDVGG